MDYKPSVVFLTKAELVVDVDSSPTDDNNDDYDVIASVDALFGAKVYSVSGCPAEDIIFAMTDKGVMNVTTAEYVSSDLFNQMVCGSGHFLGLSADNNLYSWGVGKFGELGQGVNMVEGDYPVKIAELSNVKSIASGKNHSVVVDAKGIAFSWGHNFDKQLGIYKKSTAEIIERGGCVEEVLFRPRLIPLTLDLHNRIARVGCGDTFTVVVTERGNVFSWGSGESGQLGYGRMSNRELPGIVKFDDIALDEKGVPKVSDDAIVDVACGFGHVLAMTRGGSIYTWGFNKRSQLGLGDTATRHYPTKVLLNRYCSLSNSNESEESSSDSRRPVAASKIFAEGHSSAFISEAGELYTYGSNLFNRLALKKADIRASVRGYLGRYVPDEEIDTSTRVCFPSVVSSLVNTVVSHVSFSKSQTAIMVFTQIMGISPTIIPHRNCSLLTLNGCGFYPSEDVVVKFVPFEYGHNDQIVPTGLAPRSCSGTVVSSSQITLIPPRLHDKGLYYLLLSLDGGQLGADGGISNFINAPGSIVVQVHRELTVSGLEPRIVDSRSSNGPVPCTITVLNAESLARDTSFTVKVSVKMFVADGGDAVEVSDFLDGTLVPAEDANVDETNVADSSSQLDSGSSMLEETRSSSSPSGKEKKAIERKVSFLFDYYKYAGGRGNPILTVIAQVSINKVDYTVVTSTQSPIIFHAFTPTSTSSLCLPYEASSGREVSIFGESFMPQSILPLGLDVMAEFTVTIESDKKAKGKPSKGKVVKEEPANSLVEYAPVSCNSSGEMRVNIPTWVQMMKTKVLKKGEKEKNVDPTENATVMMIRFVLQSKIVSSTSKGEKVTFNRQVLCDKALSILLINSQCAISSSLQTIKRNPSDSSPLSGSITASDGKPFDFLNSRAIVQLYSKETQQIFYTLKESEYDFVDTSNSSVINKSKINNFTLASFLSPSYSIRFAIPSLADLNSITSYVIPEKVESPTTTTTEEGEEGGEVSEVIPSAESEGAETINNEDGVDVNVPPQEEVFEEPSRDALATPFDIFSLPEFYIYVSFDTSSTLDPASAAPVAKMAKVSLFSGCVLSAAPIVPGAPVPKGGNPGLAPGATAALPCSNLLKWMTNDLAKARVRGKQAGVFVDCSVTIKPDDDSATITVPELGAMQTLEPEMKGKEKWYYVEMSVDGGLTYDSSETAIIQVAIK